MRWTQPDAAGEEGVRLVLCALLALAGCATPTKPPPPTPQAAAVTARPIERVPVRTFDAWPGAAPGGLALEVRGVREADLASIEELRELTRRFTGQALALSGVSAAEALLIPGFFSGSLVAGALILAPLAVGMNSVQQRQHEAIIAALKEADLIDGTRMALAPRLPAGSTQATLSVIVLAYGLVPKYGTGRGPLCLSVVADLVLASRGQEIYRDTVHLAPYLRSADAPPPVCANREDFAAKDGAPLRHAATDAAQVLAAIVRHRLPALPWTS
jgi:hypothetical protein